MDRRVVLELWACRALSISRVGGASEIVWMGCVCLAVACHARLESTCCEPVELLVLANGGRDGNAMMNCAGWSFEKMVEVAD